MTGHDDRAQHRNHFAKLFSKGIAYAGKKYFENSRTMDVACNEDFEKHSLTADCSRQTLMSRYKLPS